LLGTVQQGSVLGLILYAIFVSPLFDIASILSIAGNSYDFKSNKDKKSPYQEYGKIARINNRMVEKIGPKSKS
jgi:hypothetical protein